MKRAPDVDIDELVAQVERRVLARLVAALASPALPSVYSTRRGNGPQGMADETCKRVLPTIPGAVKRGRWWIVPRAAFEAWERVNLAHADTGPSPAPANDAIATEAPWSPRSALLSVGLRPTRRR